MDVLSISDHVRAKFALAAGTFTIASATTYFCQFLGVYGAVCSDVMAKTQLVQTLMVLQALDVVSGATAARRLGTRITSRRLREGLERKIIMLLLVFVGFALDGVMSEHGLNTGYVLYQWTASWYIGVEVISLYENAKALGVPFPPPLMKAAEWLLGQTNKPVPGLTTEAAPAVPPAVTSVEVPSSTPSELSHEQR